MSSLTASKLNLHQCLTIRENFYRSKDNSKDYEAFEIDQRIIELASRKDEKLLTKLTKELSQFVSNEEDMLVTIPLPPTPEEEGIDASMDWTKSSPYWHKAFKDEFYTNNNGGLVAIPSIILEF